MTWPTFLPAALAVALVALVTLAAVAVAVLGRRGGFVKELFFLVDKKLQICDGMDRITGSRINSEMKRFICSTHCIYVILTHQTVLSLTCKPYTVFFSFKA